MTVASHQHISGSLLPLPGHLRPDDAAAAGSGGAAQVRSVAGVDSEPAAAAWARAAMSWHRPQSTEIDVLQAVVDGASALVPGAVGAAILSGPSPRSAPGRPQVVVTGGALAGLTATAGQSAAGNLLYAAAHPWETAGRECHGWPIATSTAAPGDRGGMIWVPLGQGATLCGTLLIATDGAVTECAEAAAVITAMHASTAVVAAREREHQRTALAGRDVIGQAKGIVMERLRLTAEAAFELLSHASQDSNVKLRDVCIGVCATGDVGQLRREPSWK